MFRAFIACGSGAGLDLDLLGTRLRRHRLFRGDRAPPVGDHRPDRGTADPDHAAANGSARAGGFETILGCEFLIVADEAKIGDVQTDAGVVPACVTLRLKCRIGEQRAKEVMWTARWYTGAEAVAIGLAITSVPPASLLDEAGAFAASMTDKPRPAIAALKRIFIEGSELGVDAGTELELKAFVRYMSSAPYGRESYRAYPEKRPPSWKRTLRPFRVGCLPPPVHAAPARVSLAAATREPP